MAETEAWKVRDRKEKYRIVRSSTHGCGRAGVWHRAQEVGEVKEAENAAAVAEELAVKGRRTQLVVAAWYGKKDQATCG